MDDDIDSAEAVAMTGLRLSGWEKREFSSLSFPDTVRKLSLTRVCVYKICVYMCVPES